MARFSANRRSFIFLLALTLFPATARCLDVPAGLSWLKAQQAADGSWGAADAGAVRRFQASAAALEALAAWGDTGSAYTAGSSWLASQWSLVTEEFCWKLISADRTDPATTFTISSLLAMRSATGWGVASGSFPEALDTAMALRSLGIAGGADPSAVGAAISFLTSSQRSDGGWGFGGNGSDVFLTAQVLEALVALRDDFDVETAIANSLSFLRSCAFSDGRIGTDLVSTASGFAAAVQAGENVLVSFPTTEGYLSSRQTTDGGAWEEDVFTTAVVLRALSRMRPNLAITAADITFSNPFPIEGESITVSLAVRNNGPAAAANILVRLYDGDAGGGTLIGTDFRIPYLAPYSQTVVPVVWNTTGKAGRHHLVAIVDELGEIPESNEIDNRVSLALLVSTLPDLVLSDGDLGISPVFPTPSDLVTVAAVIRNAGQAPVASFNATLWDGEPDMGTNLGSITVNGIEGGGATQVQWEGYLTSGSHAFTAIVDSAGVVPEMNEGNNRGSVSLFVYPVEEDLADLKVVSLAAQPQVVGEGGETLLSATVGNAGSIAAAGFTLELWEEDAGGARTLINTTPISELFAGGQSQLSWRLSPAPGAHRLTLKVDPAALIRESNETNNTVEIPVMVLPAGTSGPDLAVASADIRLLPEAPTSDDEISVEAAVRNLGNVDAADVAVCLFDGDPATQVPCVALARVGLVPAGESRNVYFGVRLGVGDHQLHVVVDPFVEHVELDEANNTAVAMLRVIAPLPDLTASTEDISFSPTLPKEGESVTIAATVRNVGSVIAQNVHVVLRVGPSGSEAILLDSIIPELPPDGWVSLQGTQQLALGEHRIVLEIDPENRIQEGSEANNITASLVRILTLPDLSIPAEQAVVSPGAPWSDEKITLIATIRNEGESRADRVRVAVFDGDPAQGGLLVGQEHLIYRIHGMSDVRIEKSFFLGRGPHELYVVADLQDAVTETSETNNRLAITLSVQERPDLSFAAALSVSPATPLVGQPFQTSAVISNTGTSALTDVAVAFYDGDPGYGGVRIAEPQILAMMAPGEARPVSISSTASGGFHEIYAVLDPEGRISEANERNNRAIVGVTVASELPDLALKGGGTTFQPAAPGAGTSVTFGAEVWNVGSADVGSVTVYWYDGPPESGALIGSQTLALGASSSAHATTATTLSAGDHHVHVVVDPNNAVAEANEANNVARLRLNVGEAPGWYDDCGDALSEPHLVQGADSQLAGFGTLSPELGSVSTHPSAVVYRYEGLDPNAIYRVTAAFLEEAGSGRQERVVADGTTLFESFEVPDESPLTLSSPVPRDRYLDGVLTLSIERVAGANAVVSQIWLVRETGARENAIAGGLGLLERAATYWNSNEYVGWDGETEAYLVPIALAAYHANGRTSEAKYQAVLDKVRSLQMPDGSWAQNTHFTSYALITLAESGIVAGDPVIQNGVAWLRRQVNGDGGWGTVKGSVSEPRFTGIAILALLRCGGNKSDSEVVAGVQYLKSKQNSTGYWGYVTGDPDIVWVGPWPLIALGLATSTSEQNVVRALTRFEYLATVNSSIFVQPWYDILRVYYYLGGTSAKIQNAVNTLHAYQKADGGWTETYDTHSALYVSFLALEMLGKVGQSSAYESRGMTWLGQHIADSGTYLSTLQELDEPSTAWALTAMAHAEGYSSPSVLQAAEKTFVGFLQSTNTWSYRFFTANGGLNEPSGVVLQALAASPYIAPNETVAITNATNTLASRQNADGGWPYYYTWATNLRSTNHVLRGMIDAGYLVTSPVIMKAVSWLLSKQGVDGGWGTTYDTACSARSLLAEGRHAPEVQEAVGWIKGNQNVDGGWGSLLGQTSTVKDTALALIALSEAGEAGIEVAKGAAWLISAQNADGGWGAMTRDSSNSVSTTALAIWALSVARYNEGIHLELIFNKPWYYPADLVSMVVNPLNRTVDEIDLSGWVRDQYGSSAPLEIAREPDSFSSAFLVPQAALPGTDIASFSAFADDAQGAVAGSFVIRGAQGIQPDLSASNADIVLSTDYPQLGDRVIVRALVHNLGLIDARDVAVRFYQGDPAFGVSPIGADLLVEWIPGLGSREVSVEWMAVASVRQIHVVIDPENGIAEEREDNNSASRCVYVDGEMPASDLQITAADITVEPAAPFEGETLTVAATIHNVGSAASGSAVLRFYDFDPLVGGAPIGADAAVPALAAGGSATVTATVDTSGLTGRIYVYAVADPDYALAELNEANNEGFSFVDLRPMPLPDLVVASGGLVVAPASPLEGDATTVSVTVRNRGRATAGIQVGLYDGNPAAGGAAIGSIQAIPGILDQSEERTVTFAWATTGRGGSHTLHAVIDPAGAIAETFEDNNDAAIGVNVAPAHLGVGIAASKGSFRANEAVALSMTVANQGDAPADAMLVVEIRDSAGVLVAAVTEDTLSLAASETRSLSHLWNTGLTRNGAYTACARLIRDSRVVSEAAAAFTILPDLTVNASLVTDKVSYGPNETARLTWRVASGSVNHDFGALSATLTLSDPLGTVLLSDTRALASLVRNQLVTFDTYWGTAISAAGSYPVAVKVFEGTDLRAEAAASLVIADVDDPAALVSGMIAASPRVIVSGDAVHVTYEVRNIGNKDLPMADLAVRIVSVDDATVYAELPEQISLPKGGVHAAGRDFVTADFGARDYVVILQATIGTESAALAGTWFRIQGAPSAPSVNVPADGSEAATFGPTLAVNNAADPNDLDELTYSFELYADVGLTQLVAASGTLAEGAGTTSWAIPLTLTENTHYWWRCRAYDGWSYGPWMATASFFVNTTNDPPGAPQADSPQDGQEVDSAQPLLVVGNASDLDEDHLTYNFAVATDPAMASMVAQTVGVFETPGSTAWQVEAPLQDNTWYWWSAQADDWLDVGPWMAPVRFFVNTANDAPTAPAPIAPVEGQETPASVTLTAANATDADLDELSYLFELDADPSFASPARIASAALAEGAGTTSWPVASLLVENRDYYWRAKASDGAAESAWSIVGRFFVNAVNEPPTAPVLANPSDGGEVIAFQPELVVHNASDPDRDSLAYEFEVYADEALTTLSGSASGVEEGTAGQTTWMVSVLLSENTRYWWRCRAFDGETAGPWMPAGRFMVNTANDAPTAPGIVAPAQGASVDTLEPQLVVANAADPDGDPLTYQFEVFSDAGLVTLVGSATAVPETATHTSWTVGAALGDDRQYWWRTRAFDGERFGPWMPTGTFTVHLPVQSIAATINFDPDTLNLGSRGTWVTVYIELPLGYDVRGIGPATVILNEAVAAETRPVGFGDEDKDGIPDAMLKFRRSAVEAILAPGERVIVKVTGLVGAMAFEGIDIIRVINP